VYYERRLSVNTFRELTLLSVLIRSLLATVLGGLLGLERGMKNRPAGMRTYMLVSLGAAMVMMTNQYISQVFQTGDPARMAAQVVSGIGFLGAGTIIVTSRSQIKGLTTAAGLWAAAAMGLAVGIGFYEAALIGSVLIYFILSILHEFDDHMRRRTRQMEAYIELKENVPLGNFIRYVRENNIVSSNIQMQSDIGQGEGNVAFVVTIKGTGKQTHEEILRILRDMEGLAYMEEL
jgi:putative Mg2+ transporter-C (MgtC) family protein